MDTYLNSFYKNDKRFRTEYLTCELSPIEYKGYLIYHRSSCLFDIVKNGICIGMRAGLNGAKMRIDELIIPKQLNLF